MYEDHGVEVTGTKRVSMCPVRVLPFACLDLPTSFLIDFL